MNIEEPQEQTTTVPLAVDTELRLAKMRKQLVGIYDQVDIVHKEVDVCAEAANSLGYHQLEKVLRASIASRLFGQLKALTGVIERLGGATNLSEPEVMTTGTTLTRVEG